MFGILESKQHIVLIQYVYMIVFVLHGRVWLAVGMKNSPDCSINL